MGEQNRDELDRQLEQLALTAKQYAVIAQNNPEKSWELRRALNILVSAIQNSKRICRYESPPDIYEEALQETWIYFCKSIKQFQGGSVVAWVNYILKRRCLDAIRRRRRYETGKESLDAPLRYQGEDLERTFGDTIPDPKNFPSDLEMLLQYIDEDSEGLFQQRHIEAHPEANFREIILQQLNGKSIKDMSSEWNIPQQTVYSFFKRSWAYFLPKIQKDLQD